MGLPVSEDEHEVMNTFRAEQSACRGCGRPVYRFTDDDGEVLTPWSHLAGCLAEFEAEFRPCCGCRLR